MSADMIRQSRGARKRVRAMLVTLPEGRAQGIPGALLAPIALRANEKSHASFSHYRSSLVPAFPARQFTAYVVLSSVRRASGHRRLAFVTRDLIPASGDRDRTISPSARMLSSARQALSILTSTASRLHVRDDRDTPLR